MSFDGKQNDLLSVIEGDSRIISDLLRSGCGKRDLRSHMRRVLSEAYKLGIVTSVEDADSVENFEAKKWKKEALAHAKLESPKESVGLLVNIRGKEKYIPCSSLNFRVWFI